MIKRLFFCFILSLNSLIFSLIANENLIHTNDERLVENFVDKTPDVHKASSPLCSPYQYPDKKLNVVPTESFTTETIVNLISEDLTSSLNLNEKNQEKILTFDELSEKFVNFKKELFLQTKELATNNYSFEQRFFAKPLENNTQFTLFDIYQSLDRMVRSHPYVHYYDDTYNGQAFTTFNLPRYSYCMSVFASDSTKMQYFCSTVYNQHFIFPYDQEKAKLLVNQGTTSDQIKEVLKKIHSFLPNPGLYIKMRNTFNTRRNSKVGESIYSTLEGAPGSRRNSFTSSSLSSPQLKSILEKLSSVEVPSSELSSKKLSPSELPPSNEPSISSPAQPLARRGSKGYSEGDTTAEFLKKYQRRGSVSFSTSNSPLSSHHSPSLLSQSPTSCSFQISTLSNELRSSNRSVIPPLSLETTTIMEDI